MTNKDTLSDSQKDRLKNKLLNILSTLHKKYFGTALVIINSIPDKCRLNQKSYDHAILKKENKKKLHPTRPIRGGIYNTLISEDNVGSELNGNHLCIVISNKKKNLYSEKVNVIPIEGDGNKIDPINNIQLKNNDLEDGSLDKDPSKIIGGDIMTLDKARLGQKIGKLKSEKLDEVIEMIKAQLGIIK